MKYSIILALCFFFTGWERQIVQFYSLAGKGDLRWTLQRDNFIVKRFLCGYCNFTLYSTNRANGIPKSLWKERDKPNELRSFRTVRAWVIIGERTLKGFVEGSIWRKEKMVYKQEGTEDLLGIKDNIWWWSSQEWDKAKGTVMELMLLHSFINRKLENCCIKEKDLLTMQISVATK